MMNGRFAKWMAGLFLVLLVNTAYLAAFASPTIFYMSNVLLHLVLGLALSGGLVWWLTRSPEARQSIPLAVALFLLSLLAGLYLIFFGNVLQNRWAFWAHVVTAGLSVAALAPWIWRKANEGEGWRRFRTAFAVAAALLVVLPAVTAGWRKANPNPSNRIKNPLIVPTSMNEEGGGPQSPFFPSSANTNTKDIIPSNFFMDSQVCGECHKDIYEQWNSSAHHFASFNNQFYRKSIEYMQDVVGTEPSKWCAGCHDHAVFFNGRFERPIKEQIDTPEAHAGLACTSCHAITEVHNSMGQGSFTIEYPPLHELLTSENKVVRALDRFLTYTDPEPHKKTFMKPFMRMDSSEFCSACHKVHLDVPVNSYRWFRGFNDYDNWQASGISGQGARSFYYPAESKTCSGCHMPLVDSDDPGNVDGKVHSHRFPGANTALAYVNQDKEQMEVTEKFLKSGFITVDIFAASPVEETGETQMIRRRSAAGDEGPRIMSGIAVGEEAEQTGDVFIREVGKLAAPIDKANPVLAPGSTARVDVVVRTRAIGHFFPGGTLDAFDIWLELQARDADGRIVYWSGEVEENPDGTKGPVEPGAHFYRAYQLDGESNPIDKRNAWQARSVLYVRAIPPGAADVVHYRIKIPEDARGPLTLTAKLNYRKFAHSYTQFAYAGQPKPGQSPKLVSAHHNSQEWSFDPANIPANVSGKIKDRIPDLPIIVLAEDTAELRVGKAGQKTETVWRPVITKEDRERWNDWGIGLLLQGDLKGAEYAFLRTTEAEPGYADGWLNVARALIREGQVDKAKPFIERALKIDSSLGRIHYFKALIQKTEGDYDAALASLRTVESKYPRDRVVLNQIARILFLKREYKEALKVLERVTAVDPEDLQMHYTAMLCWRALGNQEQAAREAKLFRRFKAEESSQAITAERRRISPEDNNERQPIHEHESVPLNRLAVPTDTTVAAGAGG
ncbi:MAG TPA: tetratricopeptide repeat protein [Thermoanaerobaculia bacterium]|nr:tetratricopeptide repeat protein [Thermoanaerobaculia bacterium]